MLQGVIEVCGEKLAEANPLVSVIVTTYNHAEFLPQAINGVVSQKTDFAFELIIAEDCSTDGTRDVAIRSQAVYPEMIRVLYSDRNIGASKNYGRAYAASRGAFIALCEGDDYWRDPYKLQKQVDFLRKNPNFVATYHDSIVVADDNRIVSDSLLGKYTRDYTQDELVMVEWMPTQTLLFKKVFEEFPEEYFKAPNGDLFQISMLGNYGRAKYLTDIAKSAYRLHKGGIWSALSTEDQTVGNVTSFYWLSIYYKRIGNRKVAEEFGFRAMSLLYQSAGQSKIEFLKWGVALLYPKFYEQYSKLKRKLLAAF